MADPRDDVRHDGVRQGRDTFKIDNSTITYEADQPNGSQHVGKAVTLSAADTVALAGDGAAILGRLEQVTKDKKAVVTTEGYVELPGGNGASLTLLKPIVGDLDASANPGFIREVAAATTPTAAEVDEAALGRGQIINASVTTAVVVKL